MFEWLMLLVAPLVPHATPPQKDYVGVVAAEAAYAALLPDAAPVKPSKPIDPNCAVCSGTGKVRTGDGIGWTKCPKCQSDDVQAPMQSLPPGTSPKMQLQIKPLPTPKTSSCPNGKCSYLRT